MVSKVPYSTSSLLSLLLTLSTSCRLTKIKWSVCISKFIRILLISFSWKCSGWCLCHFLLWSNLNYLQNSHCNTSPIRANTLFALICCICLLYDWSFLLCNFIGSHILALPQLLLMELFCATLRRDSVSLLWFPFLSNVKFSREWFHLFVIGHFHTVIFLPIFVP